MASQQPDQGVTAQVQQTTEELKDKATDRMRGTLDAQSTSLGRQVGGISEALRKAGDHLDGTGNGQGAKVARQAAEHARRFGRYLESSNSDRFLADAERFARSQPWASAGIGLVAGFVSARFLKASSEGRYQSSRDSRVAADTPLRREQHETAALSAGSASGAR